MSGVVTAAKPKIGGAVHVAPLETELPTDAVASLNMGFKQLGYCSEDGLKNAVERSNSDTKAWGGTVVNSSQTDYKDTFKFVLLECTNEEVLKYVYGDTKVTGTITSGIKVSVGPDELPKKSLVFEMVMNDGIVKRMVVPCCKVTELEEITYNDSDSVGYGVTVSAYPDESGETHYEYMKKGE